MATSTLYDQGEMLAHWQSQGPFTVILTQNAPAGTESYSALTSSEVYPGFNTSIPTLNITTDWNAATVVAGQTQISNSADIVFHSPTSNGSVTIGGYAVFDGAGTPNMRRYGALQAILPAPTTGETVKIPAGQLIISES